MIRVHRRTAILALCVLAAASALFAFAGGEPAPDPAPAGETGSVVTADLTIMPPPATAPLPMSTPVSEPAVEFTPAELRYLQLLHDQDEFEAEYASDPSMVLIGTGMCFRIDAGETVPQLIDYLDNRGYTSLAAGWIVGSALQELCVPAGDR